MFSLLRKMCFGPHVFSGKAFSGVMLQQGLVAVQNGFLWCRMAQPWMLPASVGLCPKLGQLRVFIFQCQAIIAAGGGALCV